VTIPAFRVRADPGKCQGHNRCYAIPPELFVIDDWGQSAATGTGIVPADLMARVRRAVARPPSPGPAARSVARATCRSASVESSDTGLQTIRLPSDTGLQTIRLRSDRGGTFTPAG
jgi:ferredoxin